MASHCSIRATLGVSPIKEHGDITGVMVSAWICLRVYECASISVNFVNLGNLLVSVSLRDRIYRSEMGTLITPVY